jgi:hypothetical protein
MNNVTHLYTTYDNHIILEDGDDHDNRIEALEFRDRTQEDQRYSRFYPRYRSQITIEGFTAPAWYYHLAEGDQGDAIWTSDLNAAMELTRTHSYRQEGEKS